MYTVAPPSRGRQATRYIPGPILVDCLVQHRYLQGSATLIVAVDLGHDAPVALVVWMQLHCRPPWPTVGRVAIVVINQVAPILYCTVYISRCRMWTGIAFGDVRSGTRTRTG